MKFLKILISLLIIISLFGCNNTRGNGPTPRHQYTYQQPQYQQPYRYPQTQYPKQVQKSSNSWERLGMNLLATAGSVVLSYYLTKALIRANN